MIKCSDNTLLSRREELNELEQFINTTVVSIKSVAEDLGWKFSSLENDNETARCKIDDSHKMPVASLAKHEEKCRNRNDGYSTEEIESNPPSSLFFYEKSSDIISVIIDKETQSKVLHEAAENGKLGTGIRHSLSSVDVPQTSNRYITTFTPNERLAFYEYAVKTGKDAKRESAIKLEDLTVNFEHNENDDEKPKSHLEMLAEQRDYKRRRQTYRAKNVHITKKSYTEVMREVIENQVKYLEHLKKEEVKEEEARHSVAEPHIKEEREEKHRRSHHKKSSHRSPSSHSSRSSHSHRRDDRREHHSHSSKKHKHRHKSSDENS